ncbi:MAG: cytochrome c oxidase subunit I [Actinomycetota bacterium]|nr:cytochrome c oxidase subunit I [Actinomycetota bacterium]
MTAVAEPTARRSLLARPTAQTGLWSWFTTVDHKKIGLLYFMAAVFFFFVGGIEALVIRAQLAQPGADVVSADVFNQIFTMHGLTMIFFGVMPMSSAFFNYVMPLQIGSRDVAFPRLNALSFWVFLSGGLFLYSSMFVSGMPDGGWFNYAPLSLIGPDRVATGAVEIHQTRMLFYSLGLQIAGLASLVSAANFIVTMLNMRAPGMTLMRMPVFSWMTLVVSFLMLFAMPVIGIALWQLMFDVGFGSHFFDAGAGGNPHLWQHMFWLFGHPEVYILILPAFGMVSEILPTFSRKPLFGYPAIVFSGIAIGFIGWGVWAHHMFTTGMGPVANATFGLVTMIIAVPTGIKIFNWIGTLWGGKIKFTTPMLFAVGLVAMFTIGGLSGVTHSVVPHNTQQHDTYYVVAHFHYVLFGGAVFGLVAGAYYWFPKATGRMLDDRLGQIHFWTMLLGFNLTFGPMHILGLDGMPRRVYTYEAGMGWDLWNAVSTAGSVLIFGSFLVFLVNIVKSVRSGRTAGNDPWDARTIEWLTTSPPAPHNFDSIPHVTSRDELWHRKYVEGEGGRPVPVPTGGSAVVDHDQGEHEGPHIHMPDPSYFPLVAALGLPVMAYGVIFGAFLIPVGLVILLGGLFGWVLEPSEEPR